MLFKKVITEDKAIEIAKKKIPQSIHECIIKNFKKEGKIGGLSFIELENPTVKKVNMDGDNYFEIVFLKGDISWQQLSDDYKEVDIFFDGEISDDSFAKCLISCKKGIFKYTGSCNLGPR